MAAILGAALGVMWPALSGFYFGDDYYDLALARAAESPFDFFVANHYIGGYLYRPLPLAIWWVLDHVSGGPAAHYLANTLLLGAGGAALYALLRGYAYSWSLSLAAGLLYVCHPASVMTSLSLADTMDLTCTAALLGALAGFAWFVRRGRGRSPFLAGSVILFAAACLSKELAYPGPVLFGLQAWCARFSARDAERGKARSRWYLLVASVLVVAGMLSLRAVLGVSFGSEAAWIDMSRTVFVGVTTWLANLPRAIFFDALPPVPAWAVVATLLAAALLVAWWGRILSGEEPETLAPLALGGSILALAAVVQSPHTAISEPVLAAPSGSPSGYFYERYFFFALAGFLLAAAAFVSAIVRIAMRRRRAPAITASTVAPSWIGAAALVPLIVVAGLRSHHAAEQWAVVTQGPIKDLFINAALTAARDVSDHPGPHCQLIFLESGSPVFRAYAEPAIKVLAKQRSVDDCVILTETEPIYSFSSLASEKLYRWSSAAPRQPGKPVRFRNWLMIPAGMASSTIADAESTFFVYSSASRTFERAAARPR